MSAESLIAVSAAYLVVVYGFYPALVHLRALFFPSRPGGQSLPLAFDAAIVAISDDAHDRVKARLQNLLASDYGTRPGEGTLRLVLVCRTGDGAARRARELKDPRLKVVELPAATPHGICLNEGVNACGTADIVIFTTMASTFAADTLQRLIGPFRDPRVGAACGVIRLQNPPGESAAAAAIFLRAGEWLRSAEATTDSAVGGLPPPFALRRGLIPVFAPNDRLESLIAPMHAASRGRRVVLAADALAYDDPAPATSEFRRIRQRTAALVATLLRTPARILGNRLAPLTVFHEILRLFSPLAFLVLFAASAVTARDSALWTTAFAVLLAAVLIALAGAAGLWRRPWFPIAVLSRCAIRSAAMLAGLADVPAQLFQTTPARANAAIPAPADPVENPPDTPNDSLSSKADEATDPRITTPSSVAPATDQPPVSNPG